MARRIVIIGANAAGVEAASAARKKDRTAEITLSLKKKPLVTAAAVYPLLSVVKFQF